MASGDPSQADITIDLSSSADVDLQAELRRLTEVLSAQRQQVSQLSQSSPSATGSLANVGSSLLGNTATRIVGAMATLYQTLKEMQERSDAIRTAAAEADKARYSALIVERELQNRRLQDAYERAKQERSEAKKQRVIEAYNYRSGAVRTTEDYEAAKQRHLSSKENYKKAKANYEQARSAPPPLPPSPARPQPPAPRPSPAAAQPAASSPARPSAPARPSSPAAPARPSSPAAPAAPLASPAGPASPASSPARPSSPAAPVSHSGSSGIGGLASVAGAAGAVAIAFQQIYDAGKSLYLQLNQSTEALSQYNGQLAIAKASQETQVTFAKIRRASQQGETLTEFTNQQTRLAVSWESLEGKLQTGLAKVLNPILEKIANIVDMIDVLSDVAGEVGVSIEGILSIAQPMYEVVLELNEIGMEGWAAVLNWFNIDIEERRKKKAEEAKEAASLFFDALLKVPAMEDKGRGEKPPDPQKGVIF